MQPALKLPRINSSRQKRNLFCIFSFLLNLGLLKAMGGLAHLVLGLVHVDLFRSQVLFVAGNGLVRFFHGLLGLFHASGVALLLVALHIGFGIGLAFFVLAQLLNRLVALAAL